MALRLGYPIIYSPESSIVFELVPNTIRMTPDFIIAMIAVAVATTIRLSCYRELGSMFDFQLSIRKDHQLITSGPYGVVRHPSYTAIVLHETSLLIVQFGRGSWWYESGLWELGAGRVFTIAWIVAIFGSLLYLCTRAEHEDQALHTVFGNEWEKWQKRVPYRLIPYIW
ncbi:hypothetical protein BC629DRAFT_1291787 [Irpex lacteus]|nr:hypothetical protein BC629DRAFT_1291787 [Irpex lacteus]